MSIIDLAHYLPSEPEFLHEPGVDPGDFKQAMGRLAGAVSVITVGTGQHRTGFTATSVSSFSVEPPTVLVSLNRNSSSWPALQDARSFAVNILANDQSGVADRFAGRGGIKGNDRYVGWEWSRLTTGTLGLKQAVAVIDCELDETIERHSHAILLGRVLSVTISTEAAPLLYWRGGYHDLGEAPGEQDR